MTLPVPTEPAPPQECDTSQEFTLMLAGVESGAVIVLMAFQKVRWHFTPEQAIALGAALTDAGQRGQQLRAQHPANATQNG